MSLHEAVKKTAHVLRKHLSMLQGERDDRMEAVDRPHWAYPRESTKSMAWWVHEVEAITKKVNELRAEVDKEPVVIEDVSRAEANASGHADYFRRFAFCCAKIVHDVERKVGNG